MRAARSPATVRHASDADSSHRAGGRKKRRERTSGIGRGERTRGRSHLAAPRSGAFVTSPRSRERGFARARLRPGRLTVQHARPAREVSRGCWVERSRKKIFSLGIPIGRGGSFGLFDPRFTDSAPKQLADILEETQDQKAYNGQERNPQRSPRYRATSGSGGQGNGGAFSFVRGFLPRTERAAPAGCTTPRSRNALDSLEALDAVTQSVARYDGGQGERGSAPRQREGAGRRPIVDEGHREFYAAGHRGRGVLAAARARRHAPTQPQRR